MRKLLFLMLFVTLSAMAVQANDSGTKAGAVGYFSMPEIQVQPGETFVLPVSFTCEDPVRILAFSVSFSEGFEVVKVEKGNRVNDNAMFQYGTPAGECNVAFYDLSGESIFEGNDGAVVNITLKAAENAAGDYTVTVSEGNYGIVGVYNDAQYPDDVSTTIHITTTPTPGALGYFTMPEIQVEPGETFVLPISFTCEDPVRALGIYTTVPEGFEVISVEPTDRVIGSFQYATPEGACNMAIYDINNQRVIEGNDGVIVNITLKASENLSGDYTYTINRSDYGIVGTTDALYPENVSTTIHVNGVPTPGALGYFTMPEIQVEPGETFVLPISFTCEDPVRALGIYTTVPEGFEVISVEPTDRVIGSFQYATPEGACNMAIYDINNQRVIEGNDGVIVNITLKASESLSGDYTYTINRSDYGIVGTTDALYPENVSTTIHVNGVPTPGALGYFTMPEIDAMPGDTFVLPVSFTCEDPVRILAFGVSIPDGFEVVSVEKGDRVNDNATFQYGTPAGACNVAMYDLSGERILDGNEGVIVNITLRATENVAGDYTVTVSNGNYGIVGILDNPQYPENANTTIHIHTIGALGQFSMPEIDAMPGDTFVLPVSFTCEDPVRILAFGVSIPDGFEVVSVEQGDRVNDNATFQYGTPAGECNVAIYDLSGERILDGNEGVVVNITLRATENVAGDYTVTISNGNYGIVGIYNNPQYPENANTTIHIHTIGALGQFSMPEIDAMPGETFVLPVSFSCEDPVRILAFGVSIPDGFEVVSVEQGDRVNDNATFQYGTPAGECNVAIYDLSGERILDGNEGVVVNITLKAGENTAGDYNVTVSNGNYGIVGIYNNPQYPYDVTTPIHIVAAAPECDVNGDNKVNINDVSDLISYLLSGNDDDINTESADVNHDGKISITDVSDLINYLLSH